ncbi:LOW QUALITY PROTEIN: FLYWCH-type zinc finger-containing protein 1 [Galemys pyrenaicus]|uniref:FLYWCH-type zinc finger-containing protein 1 n=1 Tax=Galemys pyrenaicus TaxID=202257 RepID=A0A8J6DG47_GALPY|nr:LOW QUALITY PROTEIN: FLYWCH-type zinc finger-containing protein 1 [Galemys pyrenaicus]
MPLPEPSEQEGESVQAGQEPPPEPGTDVVPAAPTKPRKFSKLVLLTAAKDSTRVAGAKRRGVHCIMSLGVPGPAALAKALLKTHPEAQRALEAPPEPEQKRSKLGTGASVTREQEGESVQAGQEPSPEPPEPGTDVVPVAPTKPRKFSKLALLTAVDESSGGADSPPRGAPCSMSLETTGPDTRTGTPQVLPAEGQGGTLQPAPQAPPRPRGQPDTAPAPLEFLWTPSGGRLLVLQSFLYKREKAVGDRVYWKCRRHCELGCRGRAVTRGARATEMRGHCHPPDPEGLEARRQKQKPPSAALPDGRGCPEDAGGQVRVPVEGMSRWLCPLEPEPAPAGVPSKQAPQEEGGLRALSLLRLPPKKRPTLGFGPPPLEFLRTCYGGSFLVHQSFLYKREKAVGDKVYWTCRDHALHGCRSRAITQGQRVTVMRGHCHAPDVEGLAARRQQEKAMVRLQARPDGASGQADKMLPGVDSMLYRRGPGALTLSRPRPRKRAKVKDKPQALQGEPSEDQDEELGGPEFLRTPLGGSFLVHESFLYRREKAAGEKVYWTCRDQARMGCRSRAITQGQRVTVMRGHCHPPDLGGLEALRQREKRPGTAQRGGPGWLGERAWGTGDPDSCRQGEPPGNVLEGVTAHWPRSCLSRPPFLPAALPRAATAAPGTLLYPAPAAGDPGEPHGAPSVPLLPPPFNIVGCGVQPGPPVARLAPPSQPCDVSPGGPEFLRTPLGGSFLVHESFLYRREKAAGEKVYWTCRDQARMGCRSRAITQGQRVAVMRRHCHPPDLGGLEALRQREQLPGLAQREDPGMGGAVGAELWVCVSVRPRGRCCSLCSAPANLPPACPGPSPAPEGRLGPSTPARLSVAEGSALTARGLENR